MREESAVFPFRIIPIKNKTYFVFLVAHTNLPAWEGITPPAVIANFLWNLATCIFKNNLNVLKVQIYILFLACTVNIQKKK